MSRTRFAPDLLARSRNAPEGADVKLITDILTGRDNLTYDAARVVGVLGAAAYIAFWVVQVACAHRFAPSDADAYGRGLSMVLLAMAGAVAIKKSTEPDPAPVAEPSPVRHGDCNQGAIAAPSALSRAGTGAGPQGAQP